MPVRSPHRIALSAALLAIACLVAAASDLPPGVPDAARAAGGGRPNIVLIQADDEALGQFTPRVMPRTKRLLADHGTSFRDYIATTAQCCPSRASLLTGQYAHNDGVTSNEAGYSALVDKGNVLPVWLRRAGYVTMHVGKFMNGYQKFARPDTQVAPGWDEWYSLLGVPRYYDYDLFVNGRVVHRRSRPADNATHVVTHKAVKLIRSHARQRRPFYLQLDEPAPHIAAQRDPFGKCDRAPIPERGDEKAFRNAALPRPPSFNERDIRDKPAFLSSAPRLGRAERRAVKKHWRCALASLVGVDRSVSRVYHAVAKAGQVSKTVFIFISDNGQFYGEHRLLQGKVLPYDEALHLPLVIRAPKRYRGGAPRVRKVRRPVANIDLAPTILHFARARPCPRRGPCRTMDGRSLLPLLTRSHRWPDHRGLLTEYRVSDAGRYATCDFAGILTRGAIYVKHSRVVNPSTRQCVAADQRERYDLTRDPYELHNRCFGGSPANCPVGAKQLNLELRLSRLRDCAGIQGRDHHVHGRAFCE